MFSNNLLSLMIWVLIFVKIYNIVMNIIKLCCAMHAELRRPPIGQL